MTEQTVHPDDLAVDRFAKQMKHKLKLAREKGRNGWDDPTQCSNEYLASLLLEHVHKGDPIDIANFCMMLHERHAPRSTIPYVLQVESKAEDEGPWYVHCIPGTDTVVAASDKFDHDAWLYVTGDFGSTVQKFKYAEKIVAILNAAHAAKLHEEGFGPRGHVSSEPAKIMNAFMNAFPAGIWGHDDTE